MKRKLLVCATLAFVHQASADVTINVIENGGNVEATLSGSLNTDALGSLGGTSGGFNGYQAFQGNIAMNSATSEWFNIDVNWTPFGPGTFGNWDTSSGDPFHMFSNPALGIPIGYVTGTPLSANAAKLGSSFAALGFDVGSYVTILTGPGGRTDTVTVNIVPASGSLALLGLAGVVGMRRRR